MSKATKYTITTKVVETKKAGLFAVVDEIKFAGVVAPRTISRFKGTKEECEKLAVKIGKYWKKTLSVKVLPL